MCLQKFAHCCCEHALLSEEPCELADSHPFYLKVACPSYEIVSEVSRRSCGSGGFYCKEDEEGQFFEHVYDIVVQTQAQLDHIKGLRRTVVAQMAAFKRQADAQEVSREKAQRHPAYHAIINRMKKLRDEQMKVEQHQQAAQAVLQEGSMLAAARATQQGNGVRGQPLPLAISSTLRCKLSLDLQTRLAKITGSNIILESAVTTDAIDVSSKKKGGVAQIHSLGLEKTRMYHTPQQSPWQEQRPFAPQTTPCPSQKREDSDQSKLQTFTKGGRLVKRSIEQHPTHEASEVPSRRSPAAKEASLSTESSFVRRSARVRDKKVNYAESEASTTHSRENSPFKSDIDNNSPPKSDISPSPPPSPERNTLRRRRKVSNLKKEEARPSIGTTGRSSSTLTGLLDEWRRGVNTSNLPMQRTDSAISGALPGRVPAMNVWQPTTRMNAPEIGLPTFQTMPSNGIDCIPQNISTAMAQPNWTIPEMPLASRQYNPWNNTDWQRLVGNANYMPSTPGPVHVPSYQQNVTINQPMYNYAAIANEMAPVLQTPQVFQNTEAFQTPQAFQTAPARISFDYDQLRRSFSASKDLTPTAHIITDSVDTDPKKRSLSFSSPLPDAKRIRLSLPGDHATGTSVYDQQLPYNRGTSMSSPPKMASQQLPADKEVLAPTTPAPILAPTAVMYTHKQQIDAGDVTLTSEAPNVAEETAVDQRLIEDADHPSSDIDWGFLNDDYF